jgi:branched-chain amino acid aminotransferase
VTPVREVDGRLIDQKDGPVSQKIRDLYKSLQARSLTPIS